MKTRRPNAGPYVVYYKLFNGAASETEFQTWADTCAFMRALLIEGYNDVRVRFA